MDDQLPVAQMLRYAQDFRHVQAEERAQRARAEEALGQLQESYGMTVRALAAALELRDDGTGHHAHRVTRLALRLADRVAPDLAADPQLEYGFLLHDLGKIGVPDAILMKPGPLDEREMTQMRYHPVLGERILDSVPSLGRLVRDVVRSHHERWDGHGYPDGLVGAQIPLAARIFAVVDAFDAMTNDRPYRLASSIEAASTEIRACAGTHFDPLVAEAFCELVPGAQEAA